MRHGKIKNGDVAVIPPSLMDVLKEEYGPEHSLVEDDGDELIDAFETEWYKGVTGR
jgi:hypothetical protein